MEKSILLLFIIVLLFIGIHRENLLATHSWNAMTSKESSETNRTNVKQVRSCYKPSSTKTYVVNVSSAMLWVEPDINRGLDQPLTSNPVDLKNWMEEMNLSEKLWLVDKVETQVLYGQEVVILQTKGDWYEVAVSDQYTPKSDMGYSGWIPKSQISESAPNYETCKMAIIDSPIAFLYHSKTTRSKFLEVSFNTKLPVLSESADWIQVQTVVHGVKYIQKKDVQIYQQINSIPKPSQDDVVQTAKKFLGLPYIWAGTSGFGFDCSGFTYSIYKQHGILIGRDASVQSQQGVAIGKNNMQDGDLMFFANNQGKGQVHHVGMYIGNGKMIHSPKTGSSVEIISTNIEPYQTEFVEARRFIK